MSDVVFWCVLELLGATSAHQECAQIPRARIVADAISAAVMEYPTVPADIVAAVIRSESAFDVRARGKAGELGLLQIKRGGAIRGRFATLSDEALMAPKLNVRIGVRYLAELQALCGGDASVWLARYNGGPCRPRSRYARKVLQRLERVQGRL